jgi:hypothetical protein
MYIVFELLACVALASALGALLYVAAIVLVTVREGVKLAPSALHTITHQILHLSTSLVESSTTTALCECPKHTWEKHQAA